jgi:hypothetical protein
MDLTTAFDTSHLVAFLGGTAVGAAGKYFADLFTDQRKRQEARAEADASFKKLQRAMSALLDEIKEDLVREADKHIRELVVLPNEHVTFNSDRPRFAYFESKHVGLKDKLATLASAGYLECVRPGQTPIYRLREHFVERLVDAAGGCAENA